MNKRILSILLCLMLVAAMLVMAVPASAAQNMQFEVTADKTEAKAGDEVNFTVTLGPVTDLGAFTFVLDIPSGLTYKEGSGAIVDGAKAAMGIVSADAIANASLDFTSSSKLVKFENPYNAAETTSDVKLLTFACTVDDAAKGTLTVGIAELETVSYDTDEISTALYKTKGADVAISSDETSAPSETSADDTQAETTEETAAETTDETTAETTDETTAATQAPTTVSTPSSASPTTAPAASPKTGDGTNMYLWLLIILASVAGVVTVVYTASRKGMFTK